MTYHELVKKVQTALAKADASKIEEHIAVQVNVTGEAEGAFYMEVSGGVLYVCPYDYNDRDALVTVSGEDILAVAEGKMTMMQAYEQGKLQVEVSHEDSLGKLLALAATFPEKKPAKKAVAKKEEPKAAPAPAAEEKPAEEKPAEAKPAEEKPAAAAKKPAAKKPASRKSAKAKK